MHILIVRLGALGDVVHAVPAAAAIRRAHPDAQIDWLVEAKHRAIVDLVTVVDRVITLDLPSPSGWVDVVRRLRPAGYDVALDLQGLMKSAVLARASGARRVIGFSIWHLREKTARPFYSEVGEQPANGRAGEPANATVREQGSPTAWPVPGGHVIHKNLSLLRAIGIEGGDVEFPLADVASPAVDRIQEEVGDAPIALINPGAAWPNKRWPADRFGEVAAFLRDVRGLAPYVLWGPSEESLARAVVGASAGAARLASATSIADLLAVSRRAALIVSGDTGPLHIAAAAGTPVVGIFGPTDPGRNGPWSSADLVISRWPACDCHYDRRCHADEWCLADVTVAEVTAAIQQRLAS